MRLPLILATLACSAVLTACGGGDGDSGGVSVPDSLKDSEYEPQQSVDGCIDLWNSPANRPNRDVVRIVITYAEPPAVGVDLDGRCNVVAVYKDSKRAFHYRQGEGPNGAPYERERKVTIASLPPKLRNGKLRFTDTGDPQLVRGG